MREFDRALPEFRWSREQVRSRLIEVQRVVRVTAGRVGPRVYGNSMPTPIKDDLERWFERMADEHQREQDAKEHNRTPFRPTVEQVSQADGAMWWQSRFLVDTSFDQGPDTGPLAMLNLYLSARDARMSFPEAVKARGRGTAIPTAYRHRDHGLLIIAIGLMRDRIPNGEAGASEAPQEVGQTVLPDWWWQVDLLMGDQTEPLKRRLKMSDVFIGEMVKREEFGGRSLSKSITYAEYRGRCTFLQRVLRERKGLSDAENH